jgi:outer membrane protein assembly factor BamB
MLVIALATAALVPAAAGEAPFWPQFHGPNRDAKSTDTGLLKTWPEGGPKLLWTAQGIGQGYASVAIVDGVLYTAGNVDGRTVITAMDLDGKIVWQVENGDSWENPVPGARGTPTIDDGYLYHESPTGNVVCLDAKTGTKVWGRNILEEFHAKNIEWALAESLLIDGEHVIAKPGGPETALVALDKRTGRSVWKSPSAEGDLAGYASCILAECSGLRILMTLTAQALIGVNADSGDLLFRQKHVTPFDENITMPLYHDGQVFVSTRTIGSKLFKINVDGARASLTLEWHSERLDNQHGGVVLLDGHLYGACHVRNGSKWVCLDWKTGREIWAAKGPGKGSVVYADGMLYTLSEKGRTVTLLPATPDGYRAAGQFKIPDRGTGPTWAHPVVSGGRLYVRHGDFLYAYDVRAN